MVCAGLSLMYHYKQIHSATTDGYKRVGNLWNLRPFSIYRFRNSPIRPTDPAIKRFELQHRRVEDGIWKEVFGSSAETHLGFTKSEASISYKSLLTK